MIRWYSQPPNGVTTSSIRVVNIEDAPWFVAKDVCEALCLSKHHGGYSKHLTRFDSSEKMSLKKYGADMRTPSVTGVSLFDSLTAAHVALISESALYKLVLRSDKPNSLPFQDWVTKVVLPAIRKDGGYVLGEEKVVTGEMSEDELVLKVMQMQVVGLYLPQISQGSPLSLPLEHTPVCPFRMPMVGRGSSRG